MCVRDKVLLVASDSRFWALVQHPRTNLIVAVLMGGSAHFAPEVVSYVLFSVAGLLIVRSGWEWTPIRRHIPIEFQSPIVLTGHIPQVAPPPAQAGLLDFELYATSSMAAATRTLSRLGAKMQRGAVRMGIWTAELQRTANRSIGIRHKVLVRIGRKIGKYAAGLGKLETRYREQTNRYVDNARQWASHPANQGNLILLQPAIDGMRTATTGSRTATAGYLDSVRTVRSQNVSQAINAGNDVLISVLGRIIEDLDIVLAYCDWFDQLASGQGQLPTGTGDL